MSNVDALEIGLNILLVVKSIKGATTEQINKKVMPNKTKRTTQRYLKRLCDSGFIYSIGKNNNGLRFYLSDKSKSLLDVKDGL